MDSKIIKVFSKKRSASSSDESSSFNQNLKEVIGDMSPLDLDLG
jgi:hypothetical protein